MTQPGPQRQNFGNPTATLLDDSELLAEARRHEPEGLDGQVVAGRYRVLARIGEGGMGAVYKAEHIHMKKAVALKVLHREMTMRREAVKRFEREAIASGRISHPNVVAATDFGRLEDGACYLALDFVAGKTLTEVLEERGAMPPREVIPIISQVVEALCAAHAAGVVHRDLKPDNIMLVDGSAGPSMGTPLVKVLDFGIAKLESRNTGNTVQLTKAGTIFGTPQYMSPEQAGGTPADHRADLYAVGVILYEMLTGKPPFDSENMLAILTGHLTEEPTPLPSILPSKLVGVVERLLQKEPDDRFQSAEELRSALGVHLTVKSVLPPHRATERWLRRRLKRTSWFNAKLHLGQRSTPLWVVASGAFVLGLCLVGLVAWAFGDSALPADKTVVSKEHSEKLALATLGNREALKTLEAVAAERRLEADWEALSLGYFKIAEWQLALKYVKGFRQHVPDVAPSSELMSWVLDALSHPKFSSEAFSIAASDLGAPGADLLYQVATDPSSAVVEPEKTTAAERRMTARELRDGAAEALRRAKANASAPLSVALALEDARSCTSLKKLLPKVQKFGDERAAARIRNKQKKRGCSTAKLDDCFKCLRGNTKLARAFSRASTRKAPVFRLP